MRSPKRILLVVLFWVVAITTLHLLINFNWSIYLNDRLPEAQRKIYVAYIPVT